MFWRKSCAGWTSGSSGFCRRSLTFSRRETAEAVAGGKVAVPPDGKLPMPPGGNFSARARAASPTAGRQVSPAVGRRTSAAVGQHTSHVVGRQTFLTVGRAIPLAGGKRASPAVARGRRCFLRLLGQCCPDLRVAAQALDKRSVSVDRMAGLSEKVFLPLFGGRERAACGGNGYSDCTAGLFRLAARVSFRLTGDAVQCRTAGERRARWEGPRAIDRLRLRSRGGGFFHYKYKRIMCITRSVFLRGLFSSTVRWSV